MVTLHHEVTQVACLETSHDAEEMTLLLKCLHIWGLSQMAVYTCSSSAREVEKEDLWGVITSQFSSISEFQAAGSQGLWLLRNEPRLISCAAPTCINPHVYTHMKTVMKLEVAGCWLQLL